LSNNIIYLDNSASTPIDPRVLSAITECYLKSYANSTSNHILGKLANAQVVQAKNDVAKLINATASEITFTSGATEGISLVLNGLRNKVRAGKHIITVSTEHSAVLETCKALEQIGYEVSYLEVNNDGLIDLDQYHNAFRPDTAIVCIMMVNNETGVIQPIQELCRIAHHNNAVFVTDATQAFGKIEIDTKELGIDVLVSSAHKFYGPKGVGAVYVRKSPNVKFDIIPQLHGGKQERLRSGTLNVPGIVGMGVAANIALKELADNAIHVAALRNELQEFLVNTGKVRLNGSVLNRVNNILNVCFVGIEFETIQQFLPNVAMSNGSACTAALIEPSHVLKALGLSDDDAFSSVRFSFGKQNTRTELNYLKRHISAFLAAPVAQ